MSKLLRTRLSVSLIIYSMLVVGLTLLVLLLTSCASGPRLDVQPEAQIVKVPVITPCIDSIPQPDDPFLTDAQLLDGSSYQVVNNLRADRDARRKYESTLVSVMQACVK